MFDDLRWRITLLFLGLSALIYIALTAFGLIIFEHGLTSSIDTELRVVLSEIGHAIDVKGEKPVFRNWIRTVKTEPPRALVSVQLFDNSGVLLEKYGPSGIERLVKDQGEFREQAKAVRSIVSPITQDERVKGYVQVQLSTKDRDETLKQLRLNAVFIGVLFLLALAVTSFWISKHMTRPIQDSVQILRSFVADAGHELITPLTILQARIESLERKLTKSGIHEEDFLVASKSITRLNQVVNDLLLLSEVEDPIYNLRKTVVSLPSVIKRLQSETEKRFAEKGVQLIVDELTGVSVMGNEQALHRLCSNLLENALRYTNENGTVHISVGLSGKSAQIKFRDTGIGIPAESLPNVFERFYRVDKSRSRTSGGTGLGLAIAKAIVEAHHGSISVQSNLGEGSVFLVSLPAVATQKTS